MSRDTLLWITMILGGFLLGSVMFSQFLPQLLMKKDITAESDDHNPGATNVFASCGVSLGLLCLSLDLLKGFFPVFAACRLLDVHRLLFAVVIAAPVLGHAIAPLNQFRGGKCIATSFGVTLGLLPFSCASVALAVIYILFSTVLKIDPHRRRSMAAFGLFGALSAATALFDRGQTAMALGCVLVSLTVMLKHSKRFLELRAKYREE
ncbi:MAG: glycerol-3-phosphate acyltransferase [Oscillospiraceae bacterium]